MRDVYTMHADQHVEQLRPECERRRQRLACNSREANQQGFRSHGRYCYRTGLMTPGLRRLQITHDMRNDRLTPIMHTAFSGDAWFVSSRPISIFAPSHASWPEWAPRARGADKTNSFLADSSGLGI